MRCACAKLILPHSFTTEILAQDRRELTTDVIPSEARDLLLSKSIEKSRFLGQAALGMTREFLGSLLKVILQIDRPAFAWGARQGPKSAG